MTNFARFVLDLVGLVRQAATGEPPKEVVGHVPFGAYPGRHASRQEDMQATKTLLEAQLLWSQVCAQSRFGHHKTHEIVGKHAGRDFLFKEGDRTHIEKVHA